MDIQTTAKEDKKVRTFTVQKEWDLPASLIWKIVGQDYGDVALSHPQIKKSDFIEGFDSACEGSSRVCYFNDSGSQYLKERMVDYDNEKMTFVNKVFEAGKFPVDPAYTQARYTVDDLGNNRSRLTFDMQFRTKPAILGAMMQGKFKKLIQEYFISIEHHARTGEAVTEHNFAGIKKKYS